MNRKGMTLGDLAPAAVAFVVVAVTIGIGATVLTSIQNGQTANSDAANATQEGLDSLVELSTYLPTIAVVIAAAVVIGAIAYFRSR